ncbi:MAG: MoaD/ThiS family protein [Candidatus Melainabacteria bacterium]|nr:MoaD/ThiS family protein [Candidatus Melainabacteria bacterium]
MKEYKVKLFAQLKDRAGQSSWSLKSEQVLRTSELLESFFAEFNDLEKLKAITRIAVNEEFCFEDKELTGDEEIALIPPVSGG